MKSALNLGRCWKDLNEWSGACPHTQVKAKVPVPFFTSHIQRSRNFCCFIAVIRPFRPWRSHYFLACSEISSTWLLSKLLRWSVEEILSNRRSNFRVSNESPIMQWAHALPCNVVGTIKSLTQFFTLFCRNETNVWGLTSGKAQSLCGKAKCEIVQRATSLISGAESRKVQKLKTEFFHNKVVLSVDGIFWLTIVTCSVFDLILCGNRHYLATAPTYPAAEPLKRLKGSLFEFKKTIIEPKFVSVACPTL